MKNLVIVVLLLALSVIGYIAYAQSTAVVLATTSGDHTTCTSGAMWCLANDGLWRKLATDTTQVRVDVAAAPPVFTTVACTTATHNNSGLNASGCQIK